MSTAQQITLSGPAIDCDHCKHTIESVLGKEPGVQAVEVSVAGKTVSLTFDPSATTLDHIEQVLAEEEYPVAK